RGSPMSRPLAAPSSNGWRASLCRGSRCSGSDNGGLSTFSSRWMVGHEERRARKPATVRRRLSSNIKKDYPILQIAVYGGIEGVNKIIEPLHEPFTRVRCYARQMSGANQLALRPR